MQKHLPHTAKQAFHCTGRFVVPLRSLKLFMYFRQLLPYFRCCCCIFVFFFSYPFSVRIFLTPKPNRQSFLVSLVLFWMCASCAASFKFVSVRMDGCFAVDGNSCTNIKSQNVYASEKHIIMNGNGNGNTKLEMLMLILFFSFFLCWDSARSHRCFSRQLNFFFFFYPVNVYGRRMR